ncbi:MAG: membrane dipeptidase [Candidatus Aminicenantes bacterium]|nr:membrane dipeptidase [Candidatus Aminicenantes bacterium]
MKRREFISKSLGVLAGSTLMGFGKTAHSQSHSFVEEISHERAGHPLYFDGMTFFRPVRDDLRNSGLSGLIWDVSKVELLDGKFVRRMIPCLKSIASANKLLRENDLGLFLATRGSQIKEAHLNGKFAVFLQFQSLEPMAEDIGMIDIFYEMGLRVLQMTHHYGNPFAGGCLVKEQEWTGLTEIGVQAVAKMNELGIVPDISHGNENLVLDVCRRSTKPVIISHTGCRALVNNARCVPDSGIRAIAETGGVVGIFSMSFWLTQDPVPTVDSYIRQLEHVIKVGGIDTVGISNDYDIAGHLEAAALNNNNDEVAKAYYPWWKQHAGVLGFDELPKHAVIPELNDIRRFTTIQHALEKRGFTSIQIEKVMGGNWVRVLTESLG